MKRMVRKIASQGVARGLLVVRKGEDSEANGLIIGADKIGDTDDGGVGGVGISGAICGWTGGTGGIGGIGGLGADGGVKVLFSSGIIILKASPKSASFQPPLASKSTLTSSRFFPFFNSDFIYATSSWVIIIIF